MLQTADDAMFSKFDFYLHRVAPTYVLIRIMASITYLKGEEKTIAISSFNPIVKWAIDLNVRLLLGCDVGHAQKWHCQQQISRRS